MHIQVAHSRLHENMNQLQLFWKMLGSETGFQSSDYKAKSTVTITGTCTTTHLAFRVIVVTGLQTILKHKRFLDEQLDLNEQDPRVRSYHVVYRQPAYSENRKPEDILERALIAVFLLRCLERAQFFDDVDSLLDDMSTTIDDVKQYVGGLLLRHLQSVAVTGFYIEELQVNRGQRLDNPSQTRSVSIGSAVHCTTGLLGKTFDIFFERKCAHKIYYMLYRNRLHSTKKILIYVRIHTHSKKTVRT